MGTNQKTIFSNSIEFYRVDRTFGFLSNLYKSEISYIFEALLDCSRKHIRDFSQVKELLGNVQGKIIQIIHRSPWDLSEEEVMTDVENTANDLIEDLTCKFNLSEDSD